MTSSIPAGGSRNVILPMTVTPAQIGRELEIARWQIQDDDNVSLTTHTFVALADLMVTVATTIAEATRAAEVHGPSSDESIAADAASRAAQATLAAALGLVPWQPWEISR